MLKEGSVEQSGKCAFTHHFLVVNPKGMSSSVKRSSTFTLCSLEVAVKLDPGANLLRLRVGFLHSSSAMLSLPDMETIIPSPKRGVVIETDHQNYSATLAFVLLVRPRRNSRCVSVNRMMLKPKYTHGRNGEKVFVESNTYSFAEYWWLSCPYYSLQHYISDQEPRL